MKVEARYYKQLDNGSTQCLLCPHFCIINDGKSGICRGRQNIDGTLYAINYGECVSLAIDPIEKKPLYHFYPGSYVLSTAPNSCNLNCPFCQNSDISQEKSPTKFISSLELVEIALEKGVPGISYTYTEPFTWYEYLLDTAKLAQSKGIKNILVTNGMINPEPLKELLPLIDAANIDLKSMDENFYKKLLNGNLESVLNTIKTCKQSWFIELTNLLIPGYNDSGKLITKLIDFVLGIGIDTPLHFSRYFPKYKFTAPETPESTLEYAYKLAKQKLHYVYVGNIEIESASNTYCPRCNNLLVERNCFDSLVVGISGGKCSQCNRKADFVI